MRPIRDLHTLWQFGHVLPAGAGGPGLLIRGLSASPTFPFPVPSVGFQNAEIPAAETSSIWEAPVDVDVTFSHARLEDILEAFFLPSPGTFINLLCN